VIQGAKTFETRMELKKFYLVIKKVYTYKYLLPNIVKNIVNNYNKKKFF